MKPQAAQVACPRCRSPLAVSGAGKVVDVPLICPACSLAFWPHFCCPDANSPARHMFAATTLRVDNAGRLYAFCPDHTFTTYVLAADNRPRPPRTGMAALARFLDSMAFRLALAIEGWRWRMASRR